MRISDWSSDVCSSDRCRLEPVFDAEGRNDVADDRQGMFVILGKMVDDARFPGMQVAAAEILGADLLARRRLHQRRAGEEDRTLITDDHRLVANRGNIGTASGAASHHARDLRGARRRHVGLIEEHAPEMVAVGKYLGLMRQVRAAAVDEVDRSEEHTSELQSLMRISYAVFCLKKKNPTTQNA